LNFKSKRLYRIPCFLSSVQIDPHIVVEYPKQKIMLTPKSLKILVFSIKYAAFLRAIPYNWDSSARKLYRLTDQAYFSYRIVTWALYMGEALLFSRRVQDLLRDPMTLNLTLFVLQVIFLISMSVPCLLTIIIAVRTDEIMNIINLYVQFFVNIYGKVNISIFIINKYLLFKFTGQANLVLFGI